MTCDQLEMQLLSQLVNLMTTRENSHSLCLHMAAAVCIEWRLLLSLSLLHTNNGQVLNGHVVEVK